jgi:hypothetical protein
MEKEFTSEEMFRSCTGWGGRIQYRVAFAEEDGVS